MQINNSKKIVIKLGSSTVVDSKGQFKKKWVTSLIKDIKKYGGGKLCDCFFRRNSLRSKIFKIKKRKSS